VAAYRMPVAFATSEKADSPKFQQDGTTVLSTPARPTRILNLPGSSDPKPDFATEDQPMSCVTDLSIFSFGQAAHSNNRSASQPGASQGNSAFAANDGPSLPPSMLLDLENLTPDTLEAFFPSEQALAR
jgi:hypothetical protein